MIQQVNTVSAKMSPANQMGANGPQSADGFRSMLNDAVRKQDLGPAGKTGGRKTGQLKKTDEPEQEQTDNGQAQSALSPGTLILPNAAALFVSDSGGEPGLQAKGAPNAAGDPGQKGNASVQAPAGSEIPSQAGAALLAGKDTEGAGTPGQTIPPGAATLLTGNDAQKPKASGQGMPTNTTAVSAVEEQTETADRTLSKQGTARHIRTAGVPEDAVQSQNQAKAVSAKNEPAADSGRGAQAKEGRFSAVRQDGQTAGTGTQEQTVFSISDAKSGTPPHSSETQAGTVQTAQPSEAKDTGAGATDVSAAAASGLSALYDGGKVVIKVSEEPAQANVSPGRQVADAVVRQMPGRKTEFQMDLYPQSLGKVSVKLTSQNGLLTVELAASNPKTQSLLASGSAEIRSILQASAGQNVRTVIPQQQTQQWYGQSWDGEGGSSGNRRQEQDESSRKNRQSRVESVTADLNTGDFLSMMQGITAYAR